MEATERIASVRFEELDVEVNVDDLLFIESVGDGDDEMGKWLNCEKLVARSHKSMDDQHHTAAQRSHDYGCQGRG